MSVLLLVRRSLVEVRQSLVSARVTLSRSGDKRRRARLRATVALGASIVALLVFFSSLAQAEPPKLITYGNFGTTLPKALGVAVDQPSGDVYVTGLLDPSKTSPFSSFFASAIDKYEPTGTTDKLLTPPSPFGEALYGGAAVNPTNGNVYAYGAPSLFEGGNTSIYTYSPTTGALLSSFAVPSSRNFSGLFSTIQIATDMSGNVYVPVSPANEVLEYSSTGAPLNTFTGSGTGTLSGPVGVAVDPSGNLWVADAGNNRIEELSSANAPVGEIKSEGVQAVAVSAQGDVLATVYNSSDPCGSLIPPCVHVVEYSSTGAQIADIGAGSIGVAVAKEPSMLAVNESNGKVYVSDGLKELVWVFGPPTAPIVETELAAEVTSSEAKLGALVNPGGIETSYRFEYGTTSEYGHSTPFPAGNVGQGVSSRTVWASASGLASGTTYHYRVVASNALGEVAGAAHTFTTAPEASCSNEQFRSGFSAALPDCRAYELVTPPNEISAQPDSNHSGGQVFPWGGHGGTQAAGNGERLAFASGEVLPGSQTPGEQYLARRTPSGWSSENVVPLQSYSADRCTSQGSDIEMLSPDLTTGVMSLGRDTTLYGQEGEILGGCGADGTEVVSGEPLEVENLLLRDNTNGSYRLINAPPPGATPASASFKGAARDLSDIVFEEHAQLTTDAPGGVNDLYVWSNGVIRLVTVLPNGTPTVGSYRGISSDGSHVLFEANGGLYVREHPEREQSTLVNGNECTEPEKACTIQIDATQGSGSSGGGKSETVSSDGSHILFTDTSRLTAGSTAEAGEPDLYECTLATAGARCALTDLTVAGAGEHANVQGLAGVSEDGSYVYLVAKGVLAGNENANKEKAKPGEDNLYLRHGVTTTFIAASPVGEPCLTNSDERCSQVSPDGHYLAFVSRRSLTGYDNVDSARGIPDPEVFLFEAASGSSVCASCDPSGQPPAAAGAAIIALRRQAVHYISDSGRLFFQTAEALLPRDTNGQVDVYEYEHGGLSLISTGTSTTESSLLDASENGDDVFLLTRQKLLAQDTNEEALSIYDARVYGGFPEVASPPACTTPEGCRGTVSPQPSLYGAPSSQTFSGLGNFTPAGNATVKKKVKPKHRCRKGFVKRKSRCVKSKVRRKANNNHGGRR